MARLPVPRTELTRSIPPAVVGLIETLRENGHAGYVVGGSLRDILLGRSPADWDLATDARPERIVELFPGAVYENRFGTVAVRRDAETYEITTFRTDHDYADHRRPHRVEFGETVEADLARRDFTVNALAWGGAPGAPLGVVDPFDGRRDLAAATPPGGRRPRGAVRRGRPPDGPGRAPFGDTRVHDRTGDAPRHRGPMPSSSATCRASAWRSSWRSCSERRPHRSACGHSDRPVSFEWIAPELAAQRGIPQSKIAGEDLWDHTVRTVDAAPVDRPIVRLAALVHDIGKPATFAEGRFLGHDSVGPTSPTPCSDG